MPCHSVVSRSIPIGAYQSLYSKWRVSTLLFCSKTGTDMAIVRIITALTMDGFLPAEDTVLLKRLLRNASKGPVYWRRRSVSVLAPDFSLLDLLCMKRERPDTVVYLAEVFDAPGVELLRRLSLYHTVDELVIYVLPVMARKGIRPLNSLQDFEWKLRSCRKIGNGVIRLIYR